jgi:hypothetical protein
MPKMVDIYAPTFFSPPRTIKLFSIAKLFSSRVSLLTLVVNRRDIKKLDSLYDTSRRNPSDSMPLITRKPILGRTLNAH